MFLHSFLRKTWARAIEQRILKLSVKSRLFSATSMEKASFFSRILFTAKKYRMQRMFCIMKSSRSLKDSPIVKFEKKNFFKVFFHHNMNNIYENQNFLVAFSIHSLKLQKFLRKSIFCIVNHRSRKR